MATLQKIRRFLLRRVRPSAIKLNGVRLPLSGLARSMQDLLIDGRYETTEARVIGKYLSPQDRVIEFGTGLGYLTTLCARICGSDAVATYEANPEMLPLIEKTFRLNRVSPRLDHAAVNRDGSSVSLNVCEKFWSSSTQQRKNTVRTVAVPGVPFVQAIQDHRPSFLLMDIEGGEVDLIEETIPECVRHIAIELHEGVVGKSAVDQVRAWLGQNGFHVLLDHGDRSIIYVHRDRSAN